jgi:hypothetical protein
VCWCRAGGHGKAMKQEKNESFHERLCFLEIERSWSYLAQGEYSSMRLKIRAKQLVHAIRFDVIHGSTGFAKPEDNEKKPTKPVNLSLKTTTVFGGSP